MVIADIASKGFGTASPSGNAATHSFYTCMCKSPSRLSESESARERANERANERARESARERERERERARERERERERARARKPRTP